MVSVVSLAQTSKDPREARSSTTSISSPVSQISGWCAATSAFLRTSRSSALKLSIAVAQVEGAHTLKEMIEEEASS
jgi:hypothetical protein